MPKKKRRVRRPGFTEQEHFTYCLLGEKYPNWRVHREKQEIVSPDDGNIALPDFFISVSNSFPTVLLEVTTQSRHEQPSARKLKQERVTRAYAELNRNYCPLFLFGECFVNPDNVYGWLGVINQLIYLNIDYLEAQERVNKIALRSPKLNILSSPINWSDIYRTVTGKELPRQ